ncbi:MAG TPA: ABC transporter permease [Candidatus Saccharimonadales bacterium]|jgi:putative ABC transport system permease protein
MKSVTRGNFKTAVNSVRSSKWRSLMTMMGIIIGIVSVVTVVSIGEGVKQQVVAQTNRLGKDLITIRPGQIVKRDKDGNITNVNLFASYTTAGSLTNDDVKVVQQTKDINTAVPLSIIAGSLSLDKKQYPEAVMIGTTPDLPKVLHQKIAYGDFFTSDDNNQNGAVIGAKVAQEVFGQDVPLGQAFEFQGQPFVVRGIFDEFKTTPLALETDFNRAVFIPYQVAQDITSNKALIYEILAQAKSPAAAQAASTAVTTNLKSAHGNQEDFTVLKAGETLNVTSNILNLLTYLIGGIAAISLLVGGIGIMNVMLVSVTERMQEIGIRKAIGATSSQIRNQFLVEATVLSILGGIIGVILSLLINVLLRIFTPLQPVISWQVVALAAGVSLAVGIIFGTAPALKAARKDPIEALRNE